VMTGSRSSATQPIKIEPGQAPHSLKKPLDTGSHSNAAGERRSTLGDAEKAKKSLLGGPSAPVAG